ncbi:MAG: tetratricopeptide repeat protein [Flavobacteriales bacterium]|jgi:tetratricopeptide (TPR) repeat protein|nr:tetratricopeptide repeat protein [Flavobacteriales bacterium]
MLKKHIITVALLLIGFLFWSQENELNLSNFKSQDLPEQEKLIIQKQLELYQETKSELTQLKLIANLLDSLQSRPAIDFYADFLVKKSDQLLTKLPTEATPINNYKLIGWSYIGESYFYKNQIDSALFIMKECVSLSKTNNNLETLASNLNNLSYIYQILGNDSLAFEYIQASIPVKKQIPNNAKSLSTSYNNLGNIHEKRGEYSPAFKNYFISLKIRDSLKDYRGMGNVLNNIANLYQNTGNSTNALHYFSQSTQARVKAKDSLGLCNNYNNIGSIYHQQKKYDSAISYYLKALQVIEWHNKNRLSHPTPGQDLYAITLTNLADLYAQQGDSKKAIELHLKAIELKETYQYIPSENLGFSYYHLGQLYFNNNDFNKAEQYAQKGMLLLNKLNSPKLSNMITYLMSQIYINKGDYKKGYEMLHLSTQMKDSMVNANLISEAANRSARFKYEQKQLIDSLKAIEKERLNVEKFKTQAAKNSSQKILYISLATFIILVILIYSIIQRNKSAQKILKLKHQTLQLQINPHFFFNALNAISNYIGSNQPFIAKQYLAKFSKVMRSSLENVQQELISLEEELIFTKNYMEIEKLQHRNFEYSITIADQIETETVMLPPTIFQPFIENAILHGFIEKTEEHKGLISINIKAKNNQILFEIIDNGVGLSMPKKERDHQSLAISITTNRLQLFTKNSAALKITNHPQHSGVLVSFAIPQQ